MVDWNRRGNLTASIDYDVAPSPAPAPAPASTLASIKMKLANFLALSSAVAVNWLEPFIEKVGELTEGQIEITHYHSGSLLAGTEILSRIKTGIAQLGYMPLDYWPDQLPLALISDLPYMFDSGDEAFWVWFGVVSVLMVELGALTPPVALNIFVLKAQIPDVTLEECYRGAVPYYGSLDILIALVVSFPQITLWLPSFIGR